MCMHVCAVRCGHQAFSRRSSLARFGWRRGSQQNDDGLTLFKRGWSNATRTAFLCGRILDLDRYTALSKAAGSPSHEYFPSYRWREAA